MLFRVIPAPCPPRNLGRFSTVCCGLLCIFSGIWLRRSAACLSGSRSPPLPLRLLPARVPHKLGINTARLPRHRVFTKKLRHSPPGYPPRFSAIHPKTPSVFRSMSSPALSFALVRRILLWAAAHISEKSAAYLPSASMTVLTAPRSSESGFAGRRRVCHALITKSKDVGTRAEMPLAAHSPFHEIHSAGTRDLV